MKYLLNLFKCLPRYKYIQPLGKGAYGYVVSAHDTLKKTNVAIKKISNLSNPTILIRTLREIKLLKHFNNTDSIVNIKDVILNGFDDVFIVIELMEADLSYILKTQKLSYNQIRYLTFQLLSALESIHAAGVIHRDLKPANCLVNKDCTLKICDFGLAREALGSNMTNYVQTRWYRAPELLLGEKEYNEKIDLWSVGCIVAEMIIGEPLWPGRSTDNQLLLILETLGYPSKESNLDLYNCYSKKKLCELEKLTNKKFKKMFEKESKELTELLNNLLVYSSDERLDAKSALELQYFKIIKKKIIKMSKYEDTNLESNDCVELRKLLSFETTWFGESGDIEKTIALEEEI